MLSADKPLGFILVTGDAVLALLNGSDSPMHSNLPPDAKFITLEYEAITRSVRVIFESDALPVVREGEVIPRYDLEYYRA